ncbi:MAG: hypothetical protein M1828_007320 [Chrysothrix sp. TS-e1954]|nr:MAG: hypothetical protein M1828_007320 [Chrysothrix sp. TS-e1954]
MATDPSTFLHLVRPFPSTATTTQPTAIPTLPTTPLSVRIQPSALLSILDHTLRRPNASSRVIGTLLGTRTSASDPASTNTSDTTSASNSEIITICNCYAVPHTETTEQVEVDMDYQKSMLGMQLRANPREGLVGWYASSGELNTFSALIQNFYAGAVAEAPSGGGGMAVHLTVEADVEGGKAPEVKAYISSSIGVTPERAADSALFIPVPCSVVYTDADRSGLETIGEARDREDRTVGVMGNIESLERGVEYVLEMLERVSSYVGSVLDEEAVGNSALGRYLLDTLSKAPKVAGEGVEKDFNNHIQDVLVVSYLTNTIRTQIDLSNRLATATLNMSGLPGASGNDGASVEGGGGAGQGQKSGGGRRPRGQSRGVL